VYVQQVMIISGSGRVGSRVTTLVLEQNPNTRATLLHLLV